MGIEREELKEKRWLSFVEVENKVMEELEERSVDSV